MPTAKRQPKGRPHSARTPVEQDAIHELTDREQSQLAYLTNALVAYPHSYDELLRIAGEEAGGSSPALSSSIDALRKRFNSKFSSQSKTNDQFDRLRRIAEELLDGAGAERHAGRALSGALEGYGEVKPPRSAPRH